MRINSISACQPHVAANNNNAKNAQNQNFGMKLTQEAAETLGIQLLHSCGKDTMKFSALTHSLQDKVFFNALSQVCKTLTIAMGKESKPSDPVLVKIDSEEDDSESENTVLFKRLMSDMVSAANAKLSTPIDYDADVKPFYQDVPSKFKDLEIATFQHYGTNGRYEADRQAALSFNKINDRMKANPERLLDGENGIIAERKSELENNVVPPARTYEILEEYIESSTSIAIRRLVDAFRAAGCITDEPKADTQPGGGWLQQ